MAISTFGVGSVGQIFREKLYDMSKAVDPRIVDLSDAISLYLKFTKPDGAVVEVDGELTDSTNPANTFIQGTIDLDQVGDWSFRVGARWPSSSNNRISENGFEEVFFVL